MTYTIKQLKKMNTLRLASVYAKIKGHFPSYPFDRQMMIIAIPTVGEYQEIVETPLETAINRVTKSATQIARAIGKLLTPDEIREIDKSGEKGRKNLFSYAEALEIFTMDVIGMTYKEIANTMNSTYQMIYQVLNGNAYNWVFDMTPEYVYERSIKIIAEIVAIPMICKVKYIFNESGYSAN